MASFAADDVPLCSMLYLGGWPLEVAPSVCARLDVKAGRRCLRVWRAPTAPPGLAPEPGVDDVVECDGDVVETGAGTNLRAAFNQDARRVEFLNILSELWRRSGPSRPPRA